MAVVAADSHQTQTYQPRPLFSAPGCVAPKKNISKYFKTFKSSMSFPQFPFPVTEIRKEAEKKKSPKPTALFGVLGDFGGKVWPLTKPHIHTGGTYYCPKTVTATMCDDGSLRQMHSSR